jgi:hypothetical protein
MSLHFAVVNSVVVPQVFIPLQMVVMPVLGQLPVVPIIIPSSHIVPDAPAVPLKV